MNRFVKPLGLSSEAFILCLTRFIDGLGSGILIVVVPLYTAELASATITLPQPVIVGITVSIYSLIGAIFQPVMGAFSDRVGRRKRFMEAGFLVFILTGIAFIFVQNVEAFIVLRFIQGVGLALSFSASISMMTLLTEPHNRGQSIGIFKALRMLGLALGPAIGSLVIMSLGYLATFVFVSAIMLFGLLLIELFVKELPLPRTAPVQRRAKLTVPRNPQILTLTFAITTIGISFSVISVLESDLSARMSMSVLEFGLAFSAFSVSRLILQIPVGYLADRVGYRRSILFGLLLLVPTTALLGFVRSTAMFALLRVLQGLASAGIDGPSLALAANRVIAGNEGKQMGTINMGFGLGSAFGPMLSAYLVMTSFEATFIVNAFIVLVGAFIVYLTVPNTDKVNEPVALG